jgi:putative metalloprotease
MKRSILAILFAMLLIACEDTNVSVMTEAATDAVTAITLSDADVRDLAQRAVQASDGKYQIAPPGNPYDERLRRIIADHSRRNGYAFNFKVYLTREINAFAMADGSIRVFSGLMDLMNDEELLFVIGHEMGHVVQNHSRKQVVLFYATSALRKGLASQESEIGQIATSVLGSFAEQLTHAQFSQHEERQADQYGAAFLQAEGHDISPAVSALDKLAALARQHTFLSSHPDPEARAKRLLGGGDSGSEDQDSFLGKVLEFGEKLVIGLFNLARSLVNWLISLW